MRVQQEAAAIEQWAEKYRIPDFPQPLPVQYNVRSTRVVKNAGPDVTGFSSNGAAIREVHDCVKDGKDCCIEFELNGTQRLKYSATQLRYDEIGSKGMKNTILTYCSRHDMTAIYVGITNNVTYPLFRSLEELATDRDHGMWRKMHRHGLSSSAAHVFFWINGENVNSKDIELQTIALLCTDPFVVGSTAIQRNLDGPELGLLGPRILALPFSRLGRLARPRGFM